jgi:hypothetical protein
MKIDVEWLSKERGILHILYHKGWNWKDFEEHRRRAKELTRELSYPVSVIIEYDRDATLLPENPLRHLTHAIETADSQVDTVVMVAPSQFWRIVLALAKRLLPGSVLKNTYLVQTRDHALEILNNNGEKVNNSD